MWTFVKPTLFLIPRRHRNAPLMPTSMSDSERLLYPHEKSASIRCVPMQIGPDPFRLTGNKSCSRQRQLAACLPCHDLGDRMTDDDARLLDLFL